MIYTEWDKLTEMIVGQVYDPNTFHKASDNIEWMRDSEFRDGMFQVLEETNSDLNKLQKLLESFGVKVHRPKNLPLKYESTRMWETIIPYPGICPRDMHVVYDDKIISTIGGDPNRYTESNFFSQIMLSHTERNYISMPQPLLDSQYKPYKELEGQILYHAANILKCGELLVHTKPYAPGVHGRGTYAGLQWLKNQIPDVDWAEIPACGHADGKMALITPGLLLVKQLELIPEQLKDWDCIKMSPKPLPDWFNKVMDQKYYKERVTEWLGHWIGHVEETPFDINIISVDEKTVICNGYDKEVEDHMKKHGVEMIPFHFKHKHFWDSGLHCVTLDITREGNNGLYHSR